MIFTRNQFFILLIVLFVGPFLFYKILWLAGSEKAKGTMEFTGHGNLGSSFGLSTYPVIKFIVEKDTVYFNGNMNVDLKPDEEVMVRYQKKDHTDAKISSFTCIWGDTLAYAMGPALVILVIFFVPDIIPKQSRLRIGMRSFISVVGPERFR